MMTATQIELHNAHKARLQRIAQAATRANPKTDKDFSAALNAVDPSIDTAPEPEHEPAPEVEWAEKQIEKHKPLWFSVIDCIKLTPRGKPTIRAIQLATCEAYGVKLNDLLSARRTANLIIPRHVSMYLAYELTELSHPRIARATGDRDHTVSIYAMRKIDDLLRTDEKLRSKIAQIKAKIAGALS